MYLFSFVVEKLPELGVKTLEQIFLIVISTSIATLIGIPLSIWLCKKQKIKIFILSITNVIQTIPSLALLALLLPFLGIGFKPAIVALSLYALLPILRNTITGLEGVPADKIEAARGLGFTYLQRLWLVELPLALPVIIAGIRTAAVISAGIATLAAFIGAGGLGDFINRGLAMNDSRLIVMGAIPAALLALVFDFGIAFLQKNISTPKRRHHQKKYSKKVFTAAFVVILIGVLSTMLYITTWHNDNKKIIRVASKNFTEQFILSEIMSQLIEAKTNLKVDRKFNLGTTEILQQAMVKGDVDIYPEYTGTAYLTILHKKGFGSADIVYQKVREAYRHRFNIVWLKPFGFENTVRFTVRKKFAERHHLSKLSDLVPLSKKLVIGAPAEFKIRPDANPAFKKVYGIQFSDVKELLPGLMYSALRDKYVDVIYAFSTDGRIAAFNLEMLEDDKHVSPPYDAAPLIRSRTLKKHPEIRTALNVLAGVIDDKTMRQLNYNVDFKKQSIEAVARNFLIDKKLIGV